MENQHRKIKGYRELNETEIDLMNRIKQLGAEAEALIGEINAHIDAQFEASYSVDTDSVGASEELDRLDKADPVGWAVAGQHDLQTALMKLTRAVAQPTFF